MNVAVNVNVDYGLLDSVIRAAPSLDSFITESAAEVVVHAAKGRVPVRTGALYRSIHKQGAGNWVYVVADMHYAGFVEFGTRKMAAQPYLRPALESVRWRDIIQAGFAKIGLR